MLMWMPYRYRLALLTLALLALLLTLAWPFSPLPHVSSMTTIWYVSPNGNDANPSTEAYPFRTIRKAVSMVSGGQTIHLRAGSYHEAVNISCSGTASQPITLCAYPGEHAVLDGTHNLPGSSDCSGALMQISGSYVIVSDLEIANSTDVNLAISGSYDTARRLNVHHAWCGGVLVNGHGAGNVVEGSEVRSNSMRNENASQSSWSAGLTAARAPTQTILRGNRVHNNWGEGLSTFEADHTTIYAGAPVAPAPTAAPRNMEVCPPPQRRPQP